jgi:hypothetical protein
MAQGSPIAPDVQLPPKFPVTHRSELWHWLGSLHVLPVLPSVQVPVLAPS